MIRAAVRYRPTVSTRTSRVQPAAARGLGPGRIRGPTRVHERRERGAEKPDDVTATARHTLGKDQLVRELPARQRVRVPAGVPQEHDHLRPERNRRPALHRAPADRERDRRDRVAPKRRATRAARRSPPPAEPRMATRGPTKCTLMPELPIGALHHGPSDGATFRAQTVRRGDSRANEQIAGLLSLRRRATCRALPRASEPANANCIF